MNVFFLKHTLSNPILTYWLKFEISTHNTIILYSHQKIQAWKIRCSAFPSNGIVIHDLRSLYHIIIIKILHLIYAYVLEKQ